jgi:tRNA wybutosine-synthesizing protein 2
MGGTTGRLAVLTPLERTERTIEEARCAGVYDDDRSVVRAGDDRAEVPVTEPLDGRTVVVQEEPVRRRTGLADIVDVDDPPSSWRVLGDVILLDLADYEPDERRAIGEALLELHGAATVLDDRGVAGMRRRPDVRHVCGDRDTETVHRENGYRFRLDPREVMYSVGNARERRRVEELVETDERVLDMFAGIGYFAVPAALGGAHVTAAEIDATAHGYLADNAALNDVADRLEARHADCRDVDGRYDRVLMGHFEAPWFLDHAVQRLEEGGTIHLHAAVPRGARDGVEDATRRTLAALGADVASVDARTVKSLGPRALHVVLDCRLG